MISLPFPINGLLDRHRFAVEAAQRHPISAALEGTPCGCCRADRAPAACLLTGTRPEVERSGSAVARHRNVYSVLEAET